MSEQRDIKLNYQTVHGRGLEEGDLKVPFNANHSVIL